MIYLRQTMLTLILPGWNCHPYFTDKRTEAQEDSVMWSGLYRQPRESCDENLDLSDPKSILPLPSGNRKEVLVYL